MAGPAAVWGGAVLPRMVSHLRSKIAKCNFGFLVDPAPSAAERIVPAPDGKGGLTIVWQDSDVIYLRRHDANCDVLGSVVQVNSTREFWHKAAMSGLSDAASLGNGSMVVVWTLGGDVWLRVLSAEDDNSTPMRASALGEYRRSEARVLADPPGSSGSGGGSRSSASAAGFTVAWSSWEQDGDGWGVYARRFAGNGTPLSEELQLNVKWRGFQWKPQLLWCKSTLWALWMDGSADYCNGQSVGECASGPFARALVVDGEIRMRNVTNLHGSRPLSSALTCIGTNALALWQEARNSRTIIRSKFLSAASTLYSHDEDAGSHEFPVVVAAAMAALRALVSPVPAMIGSAVLPSSEWEQEEGEVVLSDASRGTAMIAHGSNTVIFSQLPRSGALMAQLVHIRAPHAAHLYARHPIAGAVRLERAAWDGDSALVMCWSSGLGQSQLNCVHRASSSLLPSLASSAAAGIAVVLVCVLLCSIICLRGCRAQRRIPLHQRPPPPRARRPPSQQARLRELLSRIPTVAPPSSIELESNGCGGEGDAGVCPLCHGEIFARVALQPCGHTACRECVQNVMALGKPCHICQGSIEGMQPVYL
eukprot:NODE_2792_length_2144_cov_12.151710.p1 GENE.NODE_2792_length_2144_cov_12.151710~~NODE_2792_length_2144_cov_12.151710.p1  ORF type:complete len:604 (+),score=152.04 NODE_2792_length_2144_cov_12.151710:40-1812(+)